MKISGVGKNINQKHFLVLHYAFIAFILIPNFALAAQITVSQPPEITANRAPLLSAEFGEQMKHAWFSIDGGENTTACYDCSGFSAMLNREFPQNTNGLVGWWKLDSINASNYTPDLSGAGNDGRLYSGSQSCFGESACPRLADGKFKNALSFDGVNDYVNAGNESSLNVAGAITVEAWIKGDISAHNPFIVYKELWVSGTNNGGFVLRVYNNKPYFYIENNNQKAAIASDAISNNTWHHLAGTFDGNSIIIYVNGEFKGITNAGFGAIGAHDGIPLRIGGTGYGFFNGTIDEVRIYNRSLSPEEIYGDFALSAGIHNLTVYANGGSGNTNANTARVKIKTDILLQSTAEISRHSLSPDYGSYLLVTQNTGPATFVFDVPKLDKLRVTDNAGTVLSYSNGIAHKINGWSVSYSNGNLTLNKPQTAHHDYILLDFNPQPKNLSAGYYGGYSLTQNMVDYFIDILPALKGSPSANCSLRSQRGFCQ